MSKIQTISTAGMSREQWLAERRKGVGGSDVGAILGLNPYRTSFFVWADKTGRLPDKPDNEAMRQGRDLEDYVAKRFCEATGYKVHRVNAIITNDAYPHLACNVDRLISGQDAGLECKTASALSEKRYRDGNFPEHYYAQCVAYMAVTGRKRWFLAALVLGRDFKVYQLTRDPDDETPEWCESSVYVPDEEFAIMRDAVIEFWRYVESDTEPPVDGSPSTTDALGAMYPASEDGTEIDLSGFTGLLDNYKQLKTRAAEIDGMLAETENRLKQYMGDGETGQWAGGKISWKSQTRRSLDAKRLGKDHPEIDLDGYYKITNVRPFNVTFAKEDN